MITHIRIQNLRSLVDTGFIEIKPLTILLGANSSGKSTFLRSFPLFTQSVNKSLREPISWFDDAYVDFGDFDTAKSQMAKDGEGIKFLYKINTPLSVAPKLFIMGDRIDRYQNANPYLVMPKSTIAISFMKDNKGTFVNNITIEKGDMNVVLKFVDRNSVDFLVNSEPIFENAKWKWFHGSRRKLIPEFEPQIKQEIIYTIENMIEEYAYECICRYCSKKLKHIDRLEKIIYNWSSIKEEFLCFLTDVKGLATLQNNAKSWTINSKGFKEIYNALALYHTITNLDNFDEELKSMYGNCSYIAPMRAAANRYYRTQGLQVRDVDPYGKNLQEFISSLSGNREKSYRIFTNKVLGLEVLVRNNAGHQQIVLSKNGKEVNLADVGFGYSQILPIVTKLWHSNYVNMDDKRSNYTMRTNIVDTLLIEQPELHLHPAMQARTADIMMLILNEIDAMNEQRRNNKNNKNRFWFFMSHLSKMIVETHSQAMINRIGRRIRDNQFSSDNVSILLFEKDAKTGVTNIRKIEFNDKGQLTNWPYGFFEPTDDYDILFDRQSQNKG